MTYQEIAKLLISAKAYYPNLKDDQNKIQAWLLVLEDIPYNAASAALIYHVRNSSYELKPSDIISFVKNLNSVPSAEQAWGEVKEQIRLGGIYRKPIWSCSLVEKTVKHFTYRYLCESTSPDWDRSNFIKAYDRLKERREKDSEFESALALSGNVSASIKKLSGKMELNL